MAASSSSGNPPQSSRFEKGKSGNPGGRPKLERDFHKLVEKELDELVVVSGADGKRVKLSKRQYIAKRLVGDAANGNLKAIDRVIALAAKSGSSENDLIGIEPAVLVSFLARYGPGGSSGSDEGAAA